MKKLLLLGLLLTSAVSLRAMECVDNNKNVPKVSVGKLINELRDYHEKHPMVLPMLRFDFEKIEQHYKLNPMLVVPQNLYDELRFVITDDSTSADSCYDFLKEHKSTLDGLLGNVHAYDKDECLLRLESYITASYLHIEKPGVQEDVSEKTYKFIKLLPNSYC